MFYFVISVRKICTCEADFITVIALSHDVEPTLYTCCTDVLCLLGVWTLSETRGMPTSDNPLVSSGSEDTSKIGYDMMTLRSGCVYCIVSD